MYKSLPVLLFSSADAPARPPRRSAAHSTSPDTGDSAPPSSSSETPPCCSLSATREEEDPDPPSFRGSRGDLAFPDYSLGLTESSTPITTSLQQDQQENRSTQKETSNSVPEGRSSRTLRFTRQQSVGGGHPHTSRSTTRSPAGRRRGSLRPPRGWGCTRASEEDRIQQQVVHVEPQRDQYAIDRYMNRLIHELSF